MPEPIALRAAPPAGLEAPGAHLELTWRPLVPADAADLFALIQAVEDADGAHQRSSADEVGEMFIGEWRDFARDSLGGFDAGGTLRAYGLVEVRPGDARTIRAFLSGAVHPQWRGRGIGRSLLAWTEGRGRQKLAESGKDLPARLAVFLAEDARDQRRLYAAAGFSPIRWYTTMRRDLALPLPDVVPPPEVRIVPWSAQLDADVMAAHNDAFADHWGSEPHTAESWRHHESHFAPTWSFVALVGEGSATEVVGYLVSGRYEQDWPVQGYTSGHTELLGVVRPWRGRRIAVALLARAMAAYREGGIQYATLGVDTANPTGAHGLYTSIGYEPVHGEVLYSVEL